MFYVYILQSQSTGKLYIGQTNNLNDRITRHNANRNNYTKFKGPWVLVFALELSTRSEAVTLERTLKSWKSSKAVLAWIEKNKEG